MAVDRFALPIVVPAGDVGEALPGAKLYFYVNGSSSTLHPTYTDILLTIPSTNPVIADGDGRFAEIFGNSTYSVKLTDKDDNVIGGPWDDVSITVDGSINITDGNNTSVTDVLSLTHQTTGLPGIGIGTGLALKTETASSNIETGLVIESVSTDVTGGSEDFDFVINLMSGGAAASEVFRVTSAGVVTASGSTIGDALTSNPLSQFAATTSAQLLGVISDGTGSGSLVFSNSPVLEAPNLGTPSALVATNATGTATDLTSGITNALKSATTDVNTSSATAPTTGQVLTATGTTSATWQTAGAAVGDLLTTAVALSSPTWLPSNGATYLQSSYADLYAVVGLIVNVGGIKIANPATLPPNTSTCCSFDTAANYYAVGNSTTSPRITAYSRSGVVFTKLANPATLPANNVRGCSFSGDGAFLGTVNDGSPNVTAYFNNAGVLTKLANPATLLGSPGSGCAWTSGGEYFAVCDGLSPYIFNYKRSGIGAASILTKLANPASLPTGGGFGCKWDPTDAYLGVAHFTSPYYTAYTRSGDVLTKMTTPSDLPTGYGLDAAITSGGVFHAIAHNTSPFLTVYFNDAGVLKKLSDPDALPTGEGKGCDWDSTGTILTVAHATSPFVTNYKLAGTDETATLTKIDNPATLPTGTGNGASSGGSGRFIGIAHATSPFTTIYDNQGYDPATEFAVPTGATAIGALPYIKAT